MSTKPDETPPTEPDDTPPTPPAEPPAEPPAQSTADEEGEKVPAWGKTLMQQVEGLTAALTNVVPPEGTPKPDETPTKEPWHKRGGSKA